MKEFDFSSELLTITVLNRFLSFVFIMKPTETKFQDTYIGSERFATAVFTWLFYQATVFFINVIFLRNGRWWKWACNQSILYSSGNIPSRKRAFRMFVDVFAIFLLIQTSVDSTSGLNLEGTI